ncbi:uncharacterized protein LOC135502209 [Lineus longissimus]|uniref:uncharacterized protein LOC135502209 n=1 Tax=Lineus longissimus TaxID=88925 RepID=UPI00315D77E3
MNVRRLRSIDVGAFALDVAASAVNQCVQDNASVLVETYNHDLKAILDKHAPIHSKAGTIRHKVPWYNAEVHEARIIRKKAERQWRHSKLEIHSKVNREKHVQVIRKIEKAKRDFLVEKIKDDGGDQRKLYRTVNS